MLPVMRRTKGIATKAVTAATGQPVTKALSQRGTKSIRSPILLKVTTALTTNTLIPVMTGKNELGVAFHRIPLTPRSAAMWAESARAIKGRVGPGYAWSFRKPVTIPDQVEDMLFGIMR